jgi:hypothetical protein
MVAARDLRCRMAAGLPIVLALAVPCLVAGCGENSSQPAPVDTVQAKKAQQYMQNYGEQIRAENQAKAKAKAAEKKSP